MKRPASFDEVDALLEKLRREVEELEAAPKPGDTSRAHEHRCWLGHTHPIVKCRCADCGEVFQEPADPSPTAPASQLERRTHAPSQDHENGPRATVKMLGQGAPAFIAIMPPLPETARRWWSMYCRACGIEEGMAESENDPRLIARCDEHNRTFHGSAERGSDDG